MIIWCLIFEVDNHSGLVPNLFEANDILFCFGFLGWGPGFAYFYRPLSFCIGRLFKGGDSFVVVVV